MKSLALLMLWVALANNIKNSISADRAAMLADFLDRAANAHFHSSVPRLGPGPTGLCRPGLADWAEVRT